MGLDLFDDINNGGIALADTDVKANDYSKTGDCLLNYYNSKNEEESAVVQSNQIGDCCYDITSNNIPSSLDEIEKEIDRLKLRWSEVTYLIGQRLKYISDNRLYEEKGYHDFKTYVTLAIKMSENNAYYYISVFEYFTEEQTKKAGSKLKLIIPVLNKLKREKDVSEEVKEMKMKNMRDELYYKICNKTYREAEKIIYEMRQKYFMDMSHILNYQRIKVTKDKIIINESNKELQKQIVELIEEFYK